MLNVAVTPSNPAERQGYVAKATVTCAKDKTVILSVSGSDGYSGASVLVSDVVNDDVELSVPGGASGVQDTITVEVDGVVVRTTSLVFG